MIRAMARTDSQRDKLDGYARFVGLGFSFFFIIAAFTAGGYVLDRLFGTLPVFLLLGLVAGFAGALYYLFVSLSRSGDG
jgi:ATP synthase protein I